MSLTHQPRRRNYLAPRCLSQPSPTRIHATEDEDEEASRLRAEPATYAAASDIIWRKKEGARHAGVVGRALLLLRRMKELGSFLDGIPEDPLTLKVAMMVSAH